jgi:hypothetical protein
LEPSLVPTASVPGRISTSPAHTHFHLSLLTQTILLRLIIRQLRILESRSLGIIVQANHFLAIIRSDKKRSVG